VSRDCLEPCLILESYGNVLPLEPTIPFLNFSFYSGVADRAETKIQQKSDKETEILSYLKTEKEHGKGTGKLLKRFVIFKTSPEKESLLRKHKDSLFFLGYSILGILGFLGAILSIL
jgi:hypothetical protein